MQNNYTPRWCTPTGLSEAPYNIGTSAQAKMRMNKQIPYYKVGKFIRYDLNEIDSWLSQHKVM